jgi:hypothetical protein
MPWKSSMMRTWDFVSETVTFFLLSSKFALIFYMKSLSRGLHARIVRYYGMSYYRTPEHKRLRAELIRKWKPWEQSTGPKTEEGKAASAANSIKHGMRSSEWRERVQDVNEYLRWCKEVAD